MIDEFTQSLVEQTAAAAADRAVRKTLVTLGLDPDDPLETQRDMAALREWREMMDDGELQRDLLALRKWRLTMDGVQTKGLLTLVGLLVTGMLAAFWLGLQAMLGK